MHCVQDTVCTVIYTVHLKIFLETHNVTCQDGKLLINKVILISVRLASLACRTVQQTRDKITCLLNVAYISNGDVHSS